MNTNTVEKQEVIEESNVVDLHPKPKAGGKEPPDVGTYWLKDIPVGWAVLCREKPNNQNPKRSSTANLFQILYHSEKCTQLFEPTTQQVKFWVVSNDFSLGHEWLEIIPVTPAEDAEEYSKAVEQEEMSNGTSDRKD